MRWSSLVLFTIAGCRLHIDELAIDAGERDAALDVAPDAVPCAYSCSFDTIAGTTTCSGIVTPTRGPADDAFIAVVDLGGLSELALSAQLCDPTGWTLHVGDSPTNNGFGGDSGSTQNDAELELVDQLISLYGNDFTASKLIAETPAFVTTTGCTTVVGSLRDQAIQLVGAGTFDVTSPYALRLDPPIDAEGPPDALWYLGVNRTYGSTARTGTGLRTLEVCLR